MTNLWRPDLLKNEARDEAYEYFDKNNRSLPKKTDGTIDTIAFGLEDNDIDAFRHAHVSGVLVKPTRLRRVYIIRWRCYQGVLLGLEILRITD